MWPRGFLNSNAYRNQAGVKHVNHLGIRQKGVVKPLANCKEYSMYAMSKSIQIQPNTKSNKNTLSDPANHFCLPGLALRANSF